MLKSDCQQIALRYKSRADLYHFFSIVRKCLDVCLNMFVVDAHLPSKKSCTLQYLQSLADGSKKYLERKQIPSFQVPQWPELSVAKLMSNVLTDVQMDAYFPDHY